jgi:GNAT superfamily N-acetyltransferase
MTEIRIRPFTRQDVDVFLSLVDAHADFEGLERPSPGARRRLIRDGLETPPRYAAFLATLDGRDVGYAITYEAYSSFLARPTLFLEDIFVLAECRGQGFGGAMFQYLVDEAVRRGCARMEWMVQDWNEGAIRFYERKGAIQLSEWHTYRISRGELLRLAGKDGPSGPRSPPGSPGDTLQDLPQDPSRTETP